MAALRRELCRADVLALFNVCFVSPCRTDKKFSFTASPSQPQVLVAKRKVAQLAPPAVIAGQSGGWGGGDDGKCKSLGEIQLKKGTCDSTALCNTRVVFSV